MYNKIEQAMNSVYWKAGGRMEVKPLNGHNSMNAQVIKMQDGTIILQSYATFVCMIDKNGFLSCSGLYSATTRRHISLFMREYAAPLTYYDAKSIAGTTAKINVYTGEVVEAA